MFFFVACILINTNPIIVVLLRCKCAFSEAGVLILPKFRLLNAHIHLSTRRLHEGDNQTFYAWKSQENSKNINIYLSHVNFVINHFAKSVSKRP